jgi:hypothetical protein
MGRRVGGETWDDSGPKLGAEFAYTASTAEVKSRHEVCLREEASECFGCGVGTSERAICGGGGICFCAAARVNIVWTICGCHPG